MYTSKLPTVSSPVLWSRVPEVFLRCDENMAALLRSSRLLNFSPSGVLKITGTKVIGPPLSRLYSRAVGGQRAGVGSRQFTRCSENVSRYGSCVGVHAGSVSLRVNDSQAGASQHT